MGLYKSKTAIFAILLMLLFIILVGGCQVNDPQKQPFSASTPPTSTFINTPAGDLLRTATPSHTPVPVLRPTVIETQVPLTVNGPWLLYQPVLNYPEGSLSFKPLWIANQDGTGNKSLPQPVCESCWPISITEDSDNRLVVLDGIVVLTNLQHRIAQIISPARGAEYAGNKDGGLLATINSELAEVRVYELPQGNLRSSFTIPSCTVSGQACAFYTESETWVAQWNPDGSYLVFAVIQNSSRSDLYLYDAQNGTTRLLTSIEGMPSRIWWSPGGTNILLGVSPSVDFSLDSFWAVPATGGEAHRVSITGEELGGVNLLDWLDENRFLFYSGDLQQVVTAGAYNLRMLDIRSNQETTLFGDGFLMAALDRQMGTIGLIVAVYNNQTEDGVYLIAAAKPVPQKIASIESEGIYNTYWDEDLHLFVTGDPCQEDGKGYKAFDSTGRWRCAHAASPMETPTAAESSSPDGQWQVQMKQGLWVENSGKPAVKIDDATPIQVIWRPDSGGFFYVTTTGLYYLSLPGLTVKAMKIPEVLPNGLQWGAYPVKYLWIE